MAYTKTNWENLPSTNTPINATNLNKIENNLETLNGVVLYENANGFEDNGTNVDFTLSDSLSNYSYVEIHFGRYAQVYKSVKIFNPNGKIACLDLIYYINNVARLYGLALALNNNICTFGGKFFYNFGASTQAGVAPNIAETNIAIYKVVGYK